MTYLYDKLLTGFLGSLSNPVDNLTLQNAEEEFGQDNILPTSIHQMQRLKRYGVTGITNDSRYDEKVFEVYKQVVNDILNRIKANE